MVSCVVLYIPSCFFSFVLPSFQSLFSINTDHYLLLYNIVDWRDSTTTLDSFRTQRALKLAIFLFSVSPHLFSSCSTILFCSFLSLILTSSS